MYWDWNHERVRVFVHLMSLNTLSYKGNRYDASMMNGLQAVSTWIACSYTSVTWFHSREAEVRTSFPQSALYHPRFALGHVLSRCHLFFAFRPDSRRQVWSQALDRYRQCHYGHRSRLTGCCSELWVTLFLSMSNWIIRFFLSRNVRHCSFHLGVRNSFRDCRRLIYDRRACIP